MNTCGRSRSPPSTMSRRGRRPDPGLGSDTDLPAARRMAEGQPRLLHPEPLRTHSARGVGCGDTGVVLQNRGARLPSLEPDSPERALAPGKRPFHTIIPGMLLEGGDTPRMAFGIMGGHVQAQAHTLPSCRTSWTTACNPQEALDRAALPLRRWATSVWVEEPSDAEVSEGGTARGEALGGAWPRGRGGPEPVRVGIFGGGQAIERLPERCAGRCERPPQGRLRPGSGLGNGRR